ncbi:MAG: 7TM domain-containing protein [bacterium]
MKNVVLCIVAFWVFVTPVRAEMLSASESAQFADASVSAGIVERRVEEKTDLTQPISETKNKLEKLLEDNPVGSLRWNNFMRVTVHRAVSNGVPVNTVVLIMLFPLIVAMVAAARHLIGIRGVGILTPALLAVAFLATGVWAGMALFLVILCVTILARTVLKTFKLQYLPRVSLLLWVVSAGVFLTLFAASVWRVGELVTVGIFPILILMLLAETFIDIQQGRSASEARALIFQTFALAMISSLILGAEVVQRTVLLSPELIFFGVAIFDLFMGKYTGLRLSEYIMYRGIVKEDEEE